MSEPAQNPKRPIYFLFLSFYAFSGILFVLAYLQQGIIFKALCDQPLSVTQQLDTQFIQQSSQASLTELLNQDKSFLLLNPVPELVLEQNVSIEYKTSTGLAFISQIQQADKLLYTADAFQQQRQHSCQQERNQSQRFYGASLLLFMFAGLLLWRRFRYGQPQTARKLLDDDSKTENDDK